MTVITPMQAFDLEIQSVKESYSKCVRPIYSAEDEKRRPNAIASCVLIRVGERQFGVTAAHVIDAIHKVSLHVAGIKGNQLVAIEGKITSAKARQLDFAFWELDSGRVGRFGNVRFIDAGTETRTRRTKVVDRWAVAVGYRVSRNRKGISRPNKTIKTTLSSYPDIATSASGKLKKQGYSDRDHIFIPYSKSAVKADGTKVNNPPPVGLSGGAILDFGSAASALPFVGKQQPLLAGVFTEYHKNEGLCVGVRIHLIVDAIKAHYGIVS